jgi:hypothetical protein
LTWQAATVASVTRETVGAVASLSPPGPVFIPAGGIQDGPAYRTSTQITNKEGIGMSHEQSMSMSHEPQEEPMSMGQPDQGPPSMGQPHEDST